MKKYVWYGLRLLVYVFCVSIPFGIDHSLHIGSEGVCKAHVKENEGIEGFVEGAIYKAFSKSSFRDIRSHSTAVVVLREGQLPNELFANSCEYRSFLAKIIGQTANAGASIIGIDESFEEGYCSEESANDALIKAVADASVKADIVTGLSTKTESDILTLQLPLDEQQRRRLHHTCLVISPQMDLPERTGSTRVHKGLIRLDEDNRKIPLSWSVFLSEAIEEQPTDVMSLSSIIATLKDPAVKSRPIFEKDLKRRIHPLTSFIRKDEIPTVSAADLACVGGAPVSGHDCTTAQQEMQKLKDKVVLIGDDTVSERFSTPVGEMPGVYVHANYVESLLDDRYFKTSPLWSEILMSFLWVLALEFVFGHYTTQNPWHLAGWFLAGIILCLGISWVAFQSQGLLILFGLPAAIIAVPLKLIDRIREEAV